MKNILIVDDEKFVRLGMKTLIQRSGLPVGDIIECKNGLEALEALKKQTFDLILSDIKMPLMDGIELMTKISEEKLSDAFLVIISGYDDFNYAVNAMRQGACEYLLKPVEREVFQQLLVKLEEALERKALMDVKPIENLGEHQSKQQKIQVAISYIHEHYSKDMNMAVVSNEVSMNYTFFSETFKEVTGKSFVDYVKIVRINMAKKLLRSTGLPISQVAAQVGFKDDKHFSKTFKVETNMTPSEYKRNNIQYPE